MLSYVWVMNWNHIQTIFLVRFVVSHQSNFAGYTSVAHLELGGICVVERELCLFALIVGSKLNLFVKY